jgi:hypothetical protein
VEEVWKPLSESGLGALYLTAFGALSVLSYVFFVVKMILGLI